MPGGRRPRAGRKKPQNDFDQVFRAIARAVEGEQIECVRADVDATGEFVVPAMSERLLVAEHVIADLTLGTAHVAFTVGVRHGAGSGTTLLVCASNRVQALPFGLRALGVITYDLDAGGSLGRAAAKRLEQAIAERLRLAGRGELGADNPILQVTRRRSSDEVNHAKTDVFLDRMRSASDLGRLVADALLLSDPAAAIDVLAEMERELFDCADVIRGVHTGLMGIYLGYREKAAYERMVDLYPRLPPELRSTPVAREQLALALNRLAEAAEKKGERTEAKEYRDRAFAALDGLVAATNSSETHAILGRIYKGWSDAEARAGNAQGAEALLTQAIETYEAGFRADPRDYYPGVNAVTLRVRRNTEEDRERLPRMLTLVRFAVERAPEPDKAVERYWQTATKLELACAERDWPAAEAHVGAMLAIAVEAWMRETTIGNLELQQKARADEKETVERLGRIIRALRP
jgi:tetratricopeptide (TPR) repeat protein